MTTWKNARLHGEPEVHDVAEVAADLRTFLPKKGHLGAFTPEIAPMGAISCLDEIDESSSA
jgi:hypothetical protein